MLRRTLNRPRRILPLAIAPWVETHGGFASKV